MGLTEVEDGVILYELSRVLRVLQRLGAEVLWQLPQWGHEEEFKQDATEGPHV